ncbi:MAG TPA: hypothetical protein VK084_05095 [Chitinophagaceae bacterium]|nr:hypothetical protein [Chitinophagaceae bacterium]
MLHIFDLFLGIKGRLNFLQFERYGKYGEQTYRNQFEGKDRLRPITTDYDRLGLEEKRTLLYLLDNRKITKKEAVKLLGFGETKTKEILNNLVEKKFIIRRGKGRGTYYTLKE